MASFQLQEGIDPKGASGFLPRPDDLRTRIKSTYHTPDSRDVIVHLEKGVMASIVGRVVDGTGKPQEAAFVYN